MSLNIHDVLGHILRARSYLVRPLHEEPFRLSSGEISWHYFDCERTTSYAPALPLIGEAFYDLIEDEVVAVGGPTRGADPIATAVAYYSDLQADPLNTFSIRAQLKEHGTPRYVEGSVQEGDWVAAVDDVLTSGRSLIQAIQRCWDERLKIRQVIVLVDREEGGLQRVQDFLGKALQAQAIFRYSDLISSK